MRKILFRGKRLDNGEWIEGHLIQYEDGRSRICESHTDIFCYEKDRSIIQTVAHEAETFTVGQYTGLTDKNGKQIFEGDIVRCGTGRICKVTFFISPGVSGFDLVPIGGFDAPPPRNWSLFADTEIIGNIYDNPELLKEGADNSRV